MPEMQEIEGLRHAKVDEEKKRSVQVSRNQSNCSQILSQPCISPSLAIPLPLHRYYHSFTFLFSFASLWPVRRSYHSPAFLYSLLPLLPCHGSYHSFTFPSSPSVNCPQILSQSCISSFPATPLPPHRYYHSFTFPFSFPFLWPVHRSYQPCHRSYHILTFPFSFTLQIPVHGSYQIHAFLHSLLPLLPCHRSYHSCISLLPRLLPVLIPS